MLNHELAMTRMQRYLHARDRIGTQCNSGRGIRDVSKRGHGEIISYFFWGEEEVRIGDVSKRGHGEIIFYLSCEDELLLKNL